ncbi:MAG: hypothetical protein CM15mP47_0990 [Methanobacteriota archaeon]|nr:MAG: hypothetical protein CM15mP47_0990 [Euryarchaeota archaeon]
MGCGGQLIPPKGFMKKAYDLKTNEGLSLQFEVKIWGLERMGVCFLGI